MSELPQEIGPALIVDEWKRLGYQPFDETIFSVESVHGHEYLAIVEGENLTHYDYPERHAIAALALHHTPAGFTHTDVNLLRWLHDSFSTHGGGEFFIDVDADAEAVKRLKHIADRIEALLPPQEWIMALHAQPVKPVTHGGGSTPVTTERDWPK